MKIEVDAGDLVRVLHAFARLADEKAHADETATEYLPAVRAADRLADDLRGQLEEGRPAGADAAKRMTVAAGVAVFGVWVIAGVVTLVTGDVSRFTYGCAWAVLLAYVSLYYWQVWQQL